ncbi:MAG: hypothetical protein RJA13_1932 [Bacteroidota bacterium]|jgi:hypothetical protein
MFNKFMILNLMIAITLSACSENEIMDISSSAKMYKVLISKDSIQIDSVPNLLLSCIDINLSLGSLQSLSQDQNKELFLFGQCLVKDHTFDAIWILNKSYENRVKEDNLDSLYNLISNKALIAEEFKVLLFRLRLESVDDPLLDDPYVFPCTVDAYLISNNIESILLGSTKIQSWEEYVQLQYKCIYGLKFP